VHDGKVICIGGHIQGKGKYREELAHDLWAWDPKEGIDGWRLVTDNVWVAELSTGPGRAGVG
jgi:hypothetical protein